MTHSEHCWHSDCASADAGSQPAHSDFEAGAGGRSTVVTLKLNLFADNSTRRGWHRGCQAWARLRAAALQWPWERARISGARPICVRPVTTRFKTDVKCSAVLFRLHAQQCFFFLFFFCIFMNKHGLSAEKDGVMLMSDDDDDEMRSVPLPLQGWGWFQQKCHT